jgi:hypothetical protein
MTTLKIHNIESAPEASRIIRRVSKAYGMIPDCTAFWQELQGYLMRINITRIICKQFFQ